MSVGSLPYLILPFDRAHRCARLLVSLLTVSAVVVFLMSFCFCRERAELGRINFLILLTSAYCVDLVRQLIGSRVPSAPLQMAT